MTMQHNPKEDQRINGFVFLVAVSFVFFEDVEDECVRVPREKRLSQVKRLTI